MNCRLRGLKVIWQRSGTLLLCADVEYKTKYATDSNHYEDQVLKREKETEMLEEPPKKTAKTTEQWKILIIKTQEDV